jgi:hypothetical protein
MKLVMQNLLELRTSYSSVQPAPEKGLVHRLCWMSGMQACPETSEENLAQEFGAMSMAMD